MSEVNVTQGDRDRAAEITSLYEMRNVVRSGRYDEHAYVQAFAAHRHAALLEGVRLGLEAARRAGTLVDPFCSDDRNTSAAGHAWTRGVHDFLREIVALDPAAIIAARGQG